MRAAKLLSAHRRIFGCACCQDDVATLAHKGPTWPDPASLSLHKAFHTRLPATTILITLSRLWAFTRGDPCTKEN